MRQPEVYTANKIRFWDVEVENKEIGKWVPARPMGHTLYSFWWRWGIALKVLFGIYDALNWQTPKPSVDESGHTIAYKNDFKNEYYGMCQYCNRFHDLRIGCPKYNQRYEKIQPMNG